MWAMWGYQTFARDKYVEDSPNSVRLGRDFLFGLTNGSRGSARGNLFETMAIL